MIITVDEVNAILGYSYEYDSRIKKLIPFVQNQIVDYCNNSFLDWNIYITASTISFLTRTITDSNSGFIDAEFYRGCNIKILDSKYNNGVYELKSVAAGSMEIVEDFNQSFVQEDADNTITILRVKFPEEIKLKTAMLIKSFIEGKGQLVKSESLPGGYSVTFKDDLEIMSMFNQWRKPYK